MAVEQGGVLTPDDLNDTDGRVLDVLREGRVTPRYVADEIDVSRTYASERLKRLIEHNHVAKVAPGLYELVDDPRGDQDDASPTPTVDPDTLRSALSSARAAKSAISGQRPDPETADAELDHVIDTITDALGDRDA